MSDTLLTGIHPILEALRAGRTLNKIWLADSGRRREIGEILQLARARQIPVRRVKRDQLIRLAGGMNTQGVVAQAAPKAYVSVENILQLSRSRGEAALVLVVDQVEDPQNLGALLRCADAAGVDGVIIPARHASPATAAVARASAGALAHVPLARVVNLARTLDELKAAGLLVIGLAGEADTDYFSLPLRGDLALVVGSEGRGLRRLIRQKCHSLARLPMRGHVNSLNVSAATAVALYEVLRQRLVHNNLP